MNNGEDGNKSRFLKKSNIELLAPLTVWVIILCLIYSCGWWLRGRDNSFSVGKPAAKTFFAQYSMNYRDEAMALWLKEQWSRRVFGVLLYEPEVASEIEEKLENLENGYYKNILSDRLVYLLDSLPEDKREEIFKFISIAGRKLLKAHPISISEEDIWFELNVPNLTPSEKNVAYQVLLDVFKMAMELDTRSAKAYKDYLENQIKPIEKSIKAGDVIVWKGEIVTPERAEMLLMQGYLPGEFPWRYLSFLALISALWGIWIQWYMKKKEISQKLKDKALVTVAMALGWITVAITVYFDGFGGGILALMLWMYLILEPQVAFHLVLGGGVLGILASPAYSLMDTILGLTAVGACACGGYLLIPKVQSRRRLYSSVFTLGVLMILAVLSAVWGFALPMSLRGVLVFVLSVGVSLIIGVAVLPFWERFFGVLTPLKLLDLTHPSHALLKRLQLEAPGTYHHSLMVGTLAESAAEKLGLNSLLVKAGAYFHDIGKLRRPHFFVENQRPGENVHDELTPSMSALVIVSHVRDGVELARDYQLPDRIKDFIMEHHGTTCLQYFYKKAKMAGDYVSVAQFCYPGPKPRSAETAIVMLADSVEAAVRAVWQEGKTMPDIEGLIYDVVETKIKESQLDEAPFTLRDIHIIRESFIESLRHMYHSRKVASLEPERDKTEEEKNGEQESGN